MNLGRHFFGDIQELVERAGTGAGSWDDVATMVCDSFPGAFCGINNQNKKTGEISFGTLLGFPDEGAKQYVDHFCQINPLNSAWKLIKPGQIIETEKTLPIASLSGTEFYEDFFSRYGNFDIGIGLKVAESALDELVMPIHFSPTVRHLYEPVIREMLTRLAPSLVRSGELNRHFAEIVNQGLRLGAIAARNTELAFVVDRGFQLIEASSPGQKQLSAFPFVFRSGKLALADRQAQTWFETSVCRVTSKIGSYDSRFLLVADGYRWQFHLVGLPGREHRGTPDLFGLTRYALLIVRQVGAPISIDSADFIRSRFALSRAEMRVVLELVNGQDTASIAYRLGISLETVRTHIKSAFGKTGTSRQSELVALMLQVT